MAPMADMCRTKSHNENTFGKRFAVGHEPDDLVISRPERCRTTMLFIFFSKGYLYGTDRARRWHRVAARIQEPSPVLTGSRAGSSLLLRSRRRFIRIPGSFRDGYGAETY